MRSEYKMQGNEAGKKGGWLPEKEALETIFSKLGNISLGIQRERIRDS